MLKLLNKTGIIFIILSCYTAATFAAHTAQTLQLNMPQYDYAIHYPTQWTYQDRGEGLVVFRGKTLDGLETISANIQTIATKKNGGHYVDVKALMDDFWIQVPKHAEKAAFLSRDAIELVGSDGSVLKGEQTIVTFYQHKKMLKHWQVMLMTHNGMIFQTYAFRTTADEFDKNQALAEAMFQSWQIE